MCAPFFLTTAFLTHRYNALMESRRDYTIRLLERSDLDELIAHHIRVYSSKLSRADVYEWYRKRLFDGPCGAGTSSVAVDSNNRILGIFTTFPVEIILNGEPTHISFCCGNSVDQDFQNGQMIRDLVNFFSDHNPSRFFMGFPNAEVLFKTQREFGAKLILSARQYTIALNQFARMRHPSQTVWDKYLLAALHPFSLFFPFNPRDKNPSEYHPLEIRKKETLSQDYESFWNTAKKHYPYMISRSPRMVEWMAFSGTSPTLHFFEFRHNEELVGYFILDIKKRHAVIRDFFILKRIPLAEKAIYEMLNYLRKDRSLWWVTLSLYAPFMEEVLVRQEPAYCGIYQLVITPNTTNHAPVPQEWQCSPHWYLSGFEPFLG